MSYTKMYHCLGHCRYRNPLKEELVGTIRKEFECQVQTLKSMHEKEKEELIASFKAQLAARDNEIARLKGE